MIQGISNSDVCRSMRPDLKKNALFSRMTDEQHESLCQHVRVVHLKKGEILFNQGDEVSNFYFVATGLIKLFRLSPDGHEKIFELEGDGRIFAEALMFAEQAHYPVSAAALKESILLEINNKGFLSILSQSFSTSMMIMGDLSKRLHDLINEIDNLSLMTGRNRLSTFFLDQVLKQGMEFELEIPKNAIASVLSLQPETFSRLLKELCNKNVIEVNDSHIRVLDIQELRRNAGIA